MAEPFKKTPYEVGQTAVFHIDYIPKINEASSVRSGGIGEQRSITEGKSYLEMVLVGAETPIDESGENALKKAFIKNLLKERQIKLDMTNIAIDDFKTNHPALKLDCEHLDKYRP